MDLLKNISWDALRAFEAFATERNFTRAAARLHLSQPALHTKIANLERSLDLKLYARNGRNIEITAAGRKVERFARDLESAAADFDVELRGSVATEPVVLAAGEGSYLYLLGDGLKSFCADKKRPLRLQTANAPAALEAVLSARAHLGVASVESVPAGIAIRPLTKVGQVVVMPSTHPLSKKRTVRMTDLEDTSLIVPPAGAPHRTMLARMLQSAGVRWTVAVEATGWELTVKFVELGVGLAVVNEFCRLPRGLVARPIKELPSIQYSIFHLDKKLSKPVSDLKQALLTNADAWKERNRGG